METKFEIGDVVRCECKPSAYHGVEGEVTGVRHHPAGVVYDVAGTLSGWNPVNLVLVSRASAQREGGFAVGQRVRVKASALIHEGLVGVVVPWGKAGDGYCAVLFPHQPPNSSGTAFKFDELEPADPATSQPAKWEKIGACWYGPGCPEMNDGNHSIRHGYACLCGLTWQQAATLGYIPFDNAETVAPPQPAPMTRAARVLALMEQDPYEQARNEVEARIGLDTQNHLDHYTATATDNEPKQQAARLRMAKMSLDRPLDAERARWERLVCAVHPVTSRAVRGRR